jgi:hypothetical protein
MIEDGSKMTNIITNTIKESALEVFTKGIPRMLTPPRPGLQWNEANHRWIRPKFSNDFDKYMQEVRYVKPGEGRLKLRMIGMRIYNLFRREGFEGAARQMAKDMDSLLNDKTKSPEQMKAEFIGIVAKYKQQSRMYIYFTRASGLRSQSSSSFLLFAIL